MSFNALSVKTQFQSNALNVCFVYHAFIADASKTLIRCVIQQKATHFAVQDDGKLCERLRKFIGKKVIAIQKLNSHIP
jgi:hypothetical protein